MADIIVTDQQPRRQYTSAGGVGPFAYAFPIFSDTDLNVYLTPNGTTPNDVTNILTYNVGYTVTNSAPPTSGGTITLINPSAAGDVITIVRNMPDARLNNYLAGGLFQATDVNTDFDRTVMMAQQNKMYDQNVGIHYNLSAQPVPVVDTVLPILGAGQSWAKNAGNTAIVAVTVGGGGGGAVNTVTGTANRITAAPTTGAVIVDISAAYIGQASITTLGVITSGTWNGAVIVPLYGGTGLAVADNSKAQGRLTLTTNVPVTTSDVTAATTVYYTPYIGNWISLYTAAAWKNYAFTQVSIAVPNTTDTNYDIFVYDNAGVVTLQAVAWTDATTRATALVYQDGVYCKTGDTAKRYLGSFRTTGVAGQTEDSAAKRYVWNYNNRVLKSMINTVESTASWIYTTAAFRQSNNNTANQANFLIGVSEDPVDIAANSIAANNGVATQVAVGIGLDSVTVSSATIKALVNLPVAVATFYVTSFYNGYPGVGYHYLAWLEYSTAFGTTTWYGQVAVPPLQTGLSGSGRF